jgi:hypothetical protein
MRNFNKGGTGALANSYCMQNMMVLERPLKLLWQGKTQDLTPMPADAC